MRVLLVSSGGGHLSHLWRLKPWWSTHERVWAVVDTPDARARLAGEQVVWFRGPTQRDLSKAAVNAVHALRMLRKHRPELVMSTGAALAVPFFWTARALGISTVFIEVIDRVDRPSLSGRLVAPVASRVLVQWPELLAHYSNAQLLGPMW